MSCFVYILLLFCLAASYRYGKREKGDRPMKMYVAFLLQMMIWSSFSLVEWLSGRDRPLFRGLLFCIFLYLAFLLARKVGLRTRKAIVATLFTAVFYFSCQPFICEALR
jgi:hypothetical protein